MVTGGRDCDGSTIYVGRAFHDGDMLPAKVIPDKGVAYVCHGGEEHPKDEFEVNVKLDKFLLYYKKKRDHLWTSSKLLHRFITLPEMETYKILHLYKVSYLKIIKFYL